MLKILTITIAIILLIGCGSHNNIVAPSAIEKDDTVAIDSVYHIQVVYTLKTDSSSTAIYFYDEVGNYILKATDKRISKGEFKGRYLVLMSVEWGEGADSTTGELTVADIMYIDDSRFCTDEDTLFIEY